VAISNICINLLFFAPIVSKKGVLDFFLDNLTEKRFNIPLLSAGKL